MLNELHLLFRWLLTQLKGVAGDSGMCRPNPVEDYQRTPSYWHRQPYSPDSLILRDTLRDLTLRCHCIASSLLSLFHLYRKTWFFYYSLSSFYIFLFFVTSLLFRPLNKHVTGLLLRSAPSLLVHSLCECRHHTHRMAISRFSIYESFQASKRKWIYTLEKQSASWRSTEKIWEDKDLFLDHLLPAYL